MRTPKELLIASKQYAHEQRWLSWWHLASTFTLLWVFLIISALDLPIWLRVMASVLAGLTHVRMFILYHDFEHDAILHGSRFASVLFGLYGQFSLNARSVWNRSHDHHHKNNAKMFGASIGSYPVMTSDAYLQASFGQRFAYAASRHPLTIACGYLTIFLIGMTLRPFLLNPRKHWDAGTALLLHLSVMAVLAWWSWQTMLLTLVLPAAIACAMGAYLFYAQHNFPGVQLRERADWSYVDAALSSSSYIKMNPLMAWFTGNIGYHHVHHLNSRIPFYRLPEAMAGLEELQAPLTITLRPWDVLRCFQLKVWDTETDQFVGFPKGRPPQAAVTAEQVVSS